MSTDGGLRQVFRDHLPAFDWQPVETWSTGQGVPDVNYCFAGAEGWIENKATDGWVVKVRSQQVGWIERRARHGGRVWVAVRQTGRKRDTLWMLRPAAARLLIAGTGLADLPPEIVAGSWATGPSRWGWPEVARLLTFPQEKRG